MTTGNSARPVVESNRSISGEGLVEPEGSGRSTSGGGGGGITAATRPCNGRPGRISPLLRRSSRGSARLSCKPALCCGEGLHAKAAFRPRTPSPRAPHPQSGRDRDAPPRDEGGPAPGTWASTRVPPEDLERLPSYEALPESHAQSDMDLHERWDYPHNRTTRRQTRFPHIGA